MTLYVYKNLKHVKLHGIEPFGEKTFNHKIEGGGIRLVEKIEDKKKKKNDGLDKDLEED
jgi:hypothetical protein